MTKSAVFRGFRTYRGNPGESRNNQREGSFCDLSISENADDFHRRIEVS